MKIQLKRSNVLQSGAAKEPTASQLEYGELAINYNNSDPAIFLKDSNNNIIRISGVGNIADDGLTNVPAGTTPPTNPTPESGNLWYNSDEGRLYIYYVDANTSQWVDASPDSWDPTVMPVTTNPAAQTGTLDDRYVMENGDTMTGALLLDNAASASAPDLSFDGDANTGLYSPGADQLAFATNGTGRMFIDSSGRVGIGTASSPLLFSVQGSGSTSVAEFKYTAANTVFLKLANSANDQGFIGYESSDLTFYNNNSESVRIDSSGRLLVGASTARSNFYNTSAGVSLQLEGTNYTQAGLAITCNNTSAGEVSTLTFARSNGSSVGSNTLVASGNNLGYVSFQGNDGSEFVEAATIKAQVDGTPGSNDMPGRLVFSTTVDGASSPTERLRIDSSGRIGIGTSSPTHRLTIGTQFALSTATPETISLGGTFSDTAGANPKLRLWTDGNSQMGIGVSSNQIDYITTSLYDHVFFTNSTERMRILGTGGVTFNGDTAQANALDDYEEGTWTPSVRGASTTGTYTPVYSNTRYTKIGRLVYIEAYLAWTSHTGTGNLQIHGLPFTTANVTIFPAPAIGYWHQIPISSGASPHALFTNNGNYVYFYQQLAGTAGPINVSTAGSVIFGGAYSI